MATFDFMSYETYDRDGGGTSPHYTAENTLLDQPQTISDDAGDGIFTVGEAVTVPGFAGPLFFQGTQTATDGNGDTITLVILTDNVSGTNGKMYAFSPTTVADTVFPTTMNSSSVATNASGGFTPCFAAGTLIATPDGEVTVETLRPGDLVLTAERRSVEVKWIGHKRVATRFGPAERLLPVRIVAGALGEGLPHSDLIVTADHAMLVEGVLCQAGALTNGTTIAQVPLAEIGDIYTVYHVETAAHEIIFANGAPAETFIDNVSRRVFDNFAEFEALHGDLPEIVELPLPRAMSARQLPARIRRKLGTVKAA